MPKRPPQAAPRAQTARSARWLQQRPAAARWPAARGLTHTCACGCCRCRAASCPAGLAAGGGGAQQGGRGHAGASASSRQTCTSRRMPHGTSAHPLPPAGRPPATAATARPPRPHPCTRGSTAPAARAWGWPWPPRSRHPPPSWPPAVAVVCEWCEGRHRRRERAVGGHAQGPCQHRHGAGGRSIGDARLPPLPTTRPLPPLLMPPPIRATPPRHTLPGRPKAAPGPPPPQPPSPPTFSMALRSAACASPESSSSLRTDSIGSRCWRMLLISSRVLRGGQGAGGAARACHSLGCRVGCLATPPLHHPTPVRPTASPAASPAAGSRVRQAQAPHR